MNILYLAHRLPYPPTKGDKLRAFREIDRLRRGHNVWCAYFVDDPEDEKWVGPFGAYCHESAAISLSRRAAIVRGAVSLLRGRSLTEGFYAHREMSAVLDRWFALHDFDVVVAFSSSMAQHALRVPCGRRVLDLCDCDSQKWLQYANLSRSPMSWVYMTEANRLTRLERDCLRQFDASIVISESEARFARSLAPGSSLHVITNGVQIPGTEQTHSGSFQREGAGDGQSEPRTSARADHRDGNDETPPLTLPSSMRGDGSASTLRPVIGFLGVMDYRPNVDAVTRFANECWPRIHTANRRAEFRIVGRNPTRAVRRLASIAGVKIVGAVHDIWPEVARWHVSVAPLRIARGLQNKVLECMAAGKPVVLTSMAADGIDGRHGEEYLIANSAETIAECVIGLLADPDERIRLGKNARDFVRRQHRWEDALDQFEFLVTGGTMQRSESRAGLEVPAATAVSPTTDDAAALAQ